MSDDLILMCAFRYALGRSTYVVAGVAEEMRRRRHALNEREREFFIREIETALEHDRAGMPMDQREWQMTLDALVETRLSA